MNLGKIGRMMPFVVNVSAALGGDGRVGSSIVITSGTTVTFSTELSSANYSVFIRCFDGSDNNVDYTLTEKAATGFKITPVINGTVEYIAILGEDPDIRAASRVVTIAGTAILFSSVLSGVGYSALIRCFNGNQNNVDLALTNKAVGGFTITPAINGTVEYIAIIGNTSDIKIGNEAVIVGGTPISFSSAMTSINYATGIRCYDASNNNVDFILTNKTVNGFTITPAVNGTVEYISIINS